jgi:hypothetical protein
MKNRVLCFVTALLAGLGVAGAHGQVFTPSFASPELSSDLGIYLNDGPGDFSIEGIWRRNFGTYDLGFRGGIANTRDVALLVGAELRVPLNVDDMPLSLAATGSVQGAIGNGGAAGFLGGLTIGYVFREATFGFTPYIHPRLGLVNTFRRDELELDILADIGFDISFPQNLILRFGFGLGSPTASWGIGFAWR